jgi:cold shock CspA family protein
MPTGRIRMFDDERRFGFVVAEDGDEFYVPATAVAGGGSLGTGDQVEFEIGEGVGNRRAASSVTVLKAAPAGSPVGRTMAPPPSWDSLEDRERQRRMARRRRR